MTEKERERERKARAALLAEIAEGPKGPGGDTWGGGGDTGLDEDLFDMEAVVARNRDEEEGRGEAAPRPADTP